LQEWVSGISAGNLLNSCGNHIQASNAFVAFNTESSGELLYVLLSVYSIDLNYVQAVGVWAFFHLMLLADRTMDPFQVSRHMHVSFKEYGCT
jgi:hypothetical protein